MTLETLLAYLVGSEAAIREIATQPAAVWIGLLLVASAAVSRNYAKRDLRREPVFLLAPLLASLVSALLLFALLHFIAWIEDGSLVLGLGGFRSFLGLFWFTAPLAWLYALPIERFAKTEAAAVKARLWLLGLIAAWRVALTIRVLSVLLGGSVGSMVFPVLLLGDLLALIALHVTSPRSPQAPRGTPEILQLMGGILTPRGRERDQTLRNTGGCLKALGVVTLPLWSFGAFQLDSASRWLPFPHVDPERVSGADLWILASLALVGWLLLLPAAQRKWRHARQIDSLFAAGEIAAAVEVMDSKSPAELPTAWQPLLVKDLGERGIGPLLDAVEATADRARTSWARRSFFGQLRESLREPIYYYFDDAVLARLSTLLPRLPEGVSLAKSASSAIEFFVEHRPGRRYEEMGVDPPEVPQTRRWPEETPERLAAVEAIAICAAKRRTER